MRNDDLHKLAQKLIQRWYDLRIWAPVVIARQRSFCLFLDREGHLAFMDDCGSGGIQDDSRGNPAWFSERQQFDEAVERTGCTAGHFERAMKRLWQARPRRVSCCLFLAAKLRNARRRCGDWLREHATPGTHAA